MRGGRLKDGHNNMKQLRRLWHCSVATRTKKVVKNATLVAGKLHIELRNKIFPEATDRSLPRLYRELHAKTMFAGVTWKNSYELFAASIPNLEQQIILDFGCGPRGGIAEFLGDQRVISYDPYVQAYSTPPWNRRFDVLFSSDVLEHLSIAAIKQFTDNVLACRPKYIFLNISTRSADKTFAKGTNVHLTVKPTRWWQKKLNGYWGQNYSCVVLRDGRDECTLLFQRLNADQLS